MHSVFSQRMVFIRSALLRGALCAAALLSLSLLGGCEWLFGHKVTLDNTQAQAALQTFINARNPVCQAFFAKWPVKVSDWDERNHSYHAQRLSGLFAAGLVGYQMERRLTSGQERSRANDSDYIPIKAYGLTELGKQVYHSDGAENGQFCYATKVIDHIVSVSPVNTSGKEPTGSVRFVYQLQNLAPWASNPDLQLSFPVIAREINGAGQETELHLVWRKDRWVVDVIASL